MFQVIVSGNNIKELVEAFEKHYHELTDACFGKSAITHQEVDEEKEPVVEEKSQQELPFGKNPEVKAETTVINEPVNLTSNLVLDSRGLPWDERIHAGSKGQLQDGSWRFKRKLNEDYIKEVETELRAAVQRADNPAPIPAAPTTENVEAIETPIAEPESAPVAPPKPIASVGNGHTKQTFKESFPMVIANLITEEKIDQGYLNQLAEFFKVDQIWNLDDAQKDIVFDEFVKHDIISAV